jgi:hypothetical protein
MVRVRLGLILAAVALAWAREAGAASGQPPLTKAQVQAIMSSPLRHVRAVDSKMNDVLAEGMRRSGTFAQLVMALDQSDVIVYIETVHVMPQMIAGRLLLAAGPEGSRYLRIQVGSQPRSNALIALVGHELRHALEVAESPDVRDERSLVALYQRIGHPSRGAHQYDTVAAQAAGRQVIAELM